MEIGHRHVKQTLQADEVFAVNERTMADSADVREDYVDESTKPAAGNRKTVVRNHLNQICSFSSGLLSADIQIHAASHIWSLLFCSLGSTATLSLTGFWRR